MFKQDFLDTCCFGCLINYMFVFYILYWDLFSASDDVLHGKALKIYNHYYYYYHYYYIQQIASRPAKRLNTTDSIDA